ncbi:MAG TPA: addiction module protein [Thermoanaerobaculia bacterium]|nr:addiction module protein [Thermoanaerobaculia bacterium]
MPRTLDQIEDEVLSLPEDSRARLMERLLLSFQEQPNSDKEDIARAWVEEAERRDHEMTIRGDEGTPAEEVLRKLR